MNDINEELILNRVKLYLNDEIRVMHEAVEKQVEKIFTDRVIPLISQVAKESAELAAERAVKKYCARIGLDFDNIDQMHQHSQDMHFLRQLRKEREDVRALVFNVVVKMLTTAFIAGLITAITGKFFYGR